MKRGYLSQLGQQRHLPRILFLFPIIILFLFVFFILTWGPISFLSYLSADVHQGKAQPIEPNFVKEKIKEIYIEVKPASLVSPEGLREWQSFLGKDEDDTYKDDHLFILIQEREGESLIWIQVTKLERDSRQPIIQRGMGSKRIEATIRNNDVSIKRNDYDLEEAKSILPEILRSIKDKKRLLGIKF